MLADTLNPGRTMALTPDQNLEEPIKSVELRVLVVDDQENVGLTVQQGLKKLPNYTVKLARSAEQALAFCREAPFDLMITDYEMPGTDGIALASQIREMYPQTVVLMLTAHHDDELHQQAAQAAVQRVLGKPVEITEIREAVRQVLEGG
jgi:CheY-like chemotaxis protein